MRCFRLPIALALVAASWTAAPRADAQAPATPATPPAPAATAAHDSAAAPRLPAVTLPLILDRTDLRLGVTVQFTRVPTASEIHDLQQQSGLAHVLLALDEWPSTYEDLQWLEALPEGVDCIVVMRGWPPSREAAEAWNLLRVRLRMALLVEGPPPSATVQQDLNQLRALERVVAVMDVPSRAGFERLQRPLSFLRLMP